jgi:hypothetical protein
MAASVPQPRICQRAFLQLGASEPGLEFADGSVAQSATARASAVYRYQALAAAHSATRRPVARVATPQDLGPPVVEQARTS